MFCRMLEKGIVKGKSRNLMDSFDNVPNVGEKSKIGDKLPKRSIQSSDGDKYMSCIKVWLYHFIYLFILFLSDTELAEKQHCIRISYI